MDAYEWYLNNIFQPGTIQNNPYEGWNDKTRLTPDMDLSSQIQGELANKPHYDASGRRYGSTLADDMFDIKNGRRGNPETSNHPWVGSYNDYNMGDVPVLNQNTPEVQTAIQNYINALTAGDIRDRGGRQKVVGEGVGNLYSDHYDTNEDYETEFFENPDYEAYLNDLADYKALKERQDILQGRGTGYDGIGDDVRYIKSGGQTLHESGYQRPRVESEYDAALPTDDMFGGLLVNPDRLSPKTAELIAKGTTQDRPLIPDNYGDIGGLNPVINAYRRKLGLN